MYGIKIGDRAKHDADPDSKSGVVVAIFPPTRHQLTCWVRIKDDAGRVQDIEEFHTEVLT